MTPDLAHLFRYIFFCQKSGGSEYSMQNQNNMSSLSASSAVASSSYRSPESDASSSYFQSPTAAFYSPASATSNSGNLGAAYRGQVNQGNAQTSSSSTRPVISTNSSDEGSFLSMLTSTDASSRGNPSMNYGKRQYAVDQSTGGAKRGAKKSRNPKE